MIWNRLRTLIANSLATSLIVASTAVQAQQVVTLTPMSNLKTVLNSVRPGDTLRVTGNFTAPLVLRNRDFGNLVVDASGAVFQAGINLNGVHNISFVGGTYGRSDSELAAHHTVRVDNSSHVSFADLNVIGNGDSRGNGLLVATSRFVTVRDNQFSSHMTGLSVRSSADVLVTRNRITGSTADGINIADNQRVIVSHNSCSGFLPGIGAHPDCIQLWSRSGGPLQSDIFVLNNSAIGTMQAFLSSDPKTGSGTRLTFAGNYAAVTYTHTLTCGNCTNSIFFDNVLSNLPGARNGPGSLKIGPSPTNSVGFNPLFDLRGRTDGWLPVPLWTSFVPDIAGQVGSQWDYRGFGAQISQSGIEPSAGAVPEPASWLMLGIGFATVGRQLRRRRYPRLVMA